MKNFQATLRNLFLPAWIRIRIPNPDTNSQSRYGFPIQIRIPNPDTDSQSRYGFPIQIRIPNPDF
jgi:hypothetical protein